MAYTPPLLIQIVLGLLFVRFVRVEAFRAVPPVRSLPVPSSDILGPAHPQQNKYAPPLPDRVVYRGDVEVTFARHVSRLPLLAHVLCARVNELLREGRPLDDAAAETSVPVLLVVALLAPPLAIAREIALSTKDLLARPARHARVLLDGVRYVSWVSTPPRPASPPIRRGRQRLRAAPATRDPPVRTPEAERVLAPVLA